VGKILVSRVHYSGPIHVLPFKLKFTAREEHSAGKQHSSTKHPHNRLWKNLKREGLINLERLPLLSRRHGDCSSLSHGAGISSAWNEC
jgi:hypothetical protein